MTITSILVHVDTSKEGRSRLKCARDLAERHGAALIGLGAEMIPPLAYDNGFVSADVEWYSAMSSAIEQGLAAAAQLFKSETAGLPKGATWASGVELPAQAMAGWARSADLIVASGRGRRNPSSYRDASAADLAIAVGRPVLAAPTDAPPLSGERVVLAWKDTREARRAAVDALPFLKRAEAVLILEVCAHDDNDDAETAVAAVSAFLDRHGVRAVTRVAHGAHAGQEILRAAAEFDADLIVAGAFGHSRLGEMVFGGVTRELLGQHERYVLLSH